MEGSETSDVVSGTEEFERRETDERMRQPAEAVPEAGRGAFGMHALCDFVGDRDNEGVRLECSRREVKPNWITATDPDQPEGDQPRTVPLK